MEESQLGVDYRYYEDSVSQNNLCITEEVNLREVTIKDLKINQIQTDTILRVKLISNPCSIACLMLIGQDKNNDVLPIILCNSYNRSKKTNYQKLT